MSGSGNPGCSPRLSFGMANMVGSVVQVQTITGCVYEGVFHAADLSTGPDAVGVALKKAYKKSKANPAAPFSGGREPPSRDLVINDLLIKGQDVGQILAVGLDLGYQPPPPDMSDGFTDTGISGGFGPVKGGRELEAWQPEDGMALDMTLEAPRKGKSYWSPEEMFEKNRKDHQYETSWDEDEYTSKIDKSDPMYERKRREAERIAQEILSGGGKHKTTNPHQLHDRGGTINPKLTEEDMFGSVTRTDNPHAYQPPHRRPADEPTKGDKGPGKLKQRPPSEDRELSASPVAAAASTDEAKQQLREFSQNFKLAASPKVEKRSDTNGKPDADGQSQSKPKSKNDSKGSFKLNANASEFRMSVNAPAFVPGGSFSSTPATPTNTASPVGDPAEVQGQLQQQQLGQQMSPGLIQQQYQGRPMVAQMPAGAVMNQQNQQYRPVFINQPDWGGKAPPQGYRVVQSIPGMYPYGAQVMAQHPQAIAQQQQMMMMQARAQLQYQQQAAAQQQQQQQQVQARQQPQQPQQQQPPPPQQQQPPPPHHQQPPPQQQQPQAPPGL